MKLDCEKSKNERGGKAKRCGNGWDSTVREACQVNLGFWQIFQSDVVMLGWRWRDSGDTTISANGLICQILNCQVVNRM